MMGLESQQSSTAQLQSSEGWMSDMDRRLQDKLTAFQQRYRLNPTTTTATAPSNTQSMPDEGARSKINTDLGPTSPSFKKLPKTRGLVNSNSTLWEEAGVAQESQLHPQHDAGHDDDDNAHEITPSGGMEELEETRKALAQYLQSQAGELEEFQRLEAQILAQNDAVDDAKVISEQAHQNASPEEFDAGNDTKDSYQWTQEREVPQDATNDDYSYHDHDASMILAAANNKGDFKEDHGKLLQDESFHPLMSTDGGAHDYSSPEALGMWSSRQDLEAAFAKHFGGGDSGLGDYAYSAPDLPEEKAPPVETLVSKLFRPRQADFSTAPREEPELPKEESESKPDIEPEIEIPSENQQQSAGPSIGEALALRSQVEALTSQLAKLHAQEAKRAAEFEVQRGKELAAIESQRIAAAKEIRQERILWEKQRHAAEALPTKRERQEIEAVRTQIANIQTEFRAEKARLLATQDRYRKKVEDLSRRNDELQEQVRTLERERASWLEVRNYGANSSSGLGGPKSPGTSGLGRSGGIGRASAGASATSQQPSKGAMSRSIGPANEEGGAKVTRKSRGNEWTPATQQPLVEKVDPSTWALDDMQIHLELPLPTENINHADGRVERAYRNGTRLIHHPNGSIKEQRADNTQIIHFTNGDYRQITPNGDLTYWYAEPKTLHTTIAATGLQILRFEDGQVEERYADGSSQITFPDGTMRYIFASGEEECVYPDGRVERIEQDRRRKVTDFPDGSRETYVNGVRTKTYTNGAVRILFANGTRETRLPDGRVRIQDKKGNILHNS